MSGELDIVDAEIIEVTNLRELPRDDEETTGNELVVIGWSALDKALAFHQLQEEENARSSRPFDWFDWLRSLLAAQGRKDVDGFRDLIAIGEKRGFFA